MQYSIDLTKITLEAYEAQLHQQTLLPSRRMLLDGLAQQFARLKAQGIHTVADLRKALATPKKLQAMAERSGVPTAYLRVLRQEMGALQQKPIPLQSFPGVNPAQIDSLLAQGIKTSKDYLEGGGDDELYALCDLSRIFCMGASAAKLFYDAGCHTAADIAGADAEDLLVRISAANADHQYFRGTLGRKDVRFSIEYAQLLLRYL